MEHDRNISVLQSSLSGCGAGEETQRLAGAIKERERRIRKKEPENLEAFQRKMHFCLLLNSEFMTDSALRDDPRYRSVSRIFGEKGVSKEAFLAVVSDCQLWHFLNETLPHVPDVVASSLTKMIADKSPDIEDLVYAVSMAKRCGAQSLDLKDVLQRFCESIIDEKLPIRLCRLLLLIKVLLYPFPKAEEFLNYRKPKWSAISQIYLAPDTLQSVDLNDCEPLLKAFSNTAKQVTVSHWLDMAALDVDFIRTNPFIDFWPSDDPSPAKLQFLIADYAADCLKSLKDLGYKNEETLQVMTGLAKKFERKTELNLEDLTLQQLIEKAKEETEDWKLDAYLHRLSSSELLKETLELENALDFLIGHPSKLAWSWNELFDAVNDHASDRLDELRFGLLAAKFSSKPNEEQVNVLRNHVKVHGVTCDMKSPTFDQDVVNLLNKAANKTEEDDDQYDITLANTLAFQAPRKFVEILVAEAMDNKGKIRIITNILTQIKDICLFPVPDGMLLATSIILFNFTLPNLTEGKVMNLSDLIEKLSSTSEILGNSFIQALHQAMYDDLQDCRRYVSLILRILQSGVPKETKENRELCFGMALLLQNVDSSLKEMVLQILHILNDETVTAQLPTENKAYFVSSADSFLAKLRSLYFVQEEKVAFEIGDEEKFLVALASVIPELTPTEWKLLKSVVDHWIIFDAALLSVKSFDHSNQEFILNNLAQMIVEMKEKHPEDPENLVRLHSATCRVMTELTPNLAVLLEMSQVAVLTTFLETVETLNVSQTALLTVLSQLSLLPDGQGKSVSLHQVQSFQEKMSTLSKAM